MKKQACDDNALSKLTDSEQKKLIGKEIKVKFLFSDGTVSRTVKGKLKQKQE